MFYLKYEISLLILISIQRMVSVS